MSELSEREVISDTISTREAASAVPTAAVLTEAKGGKSKEEIYLELAKLSEQSIEKRKDIEWKVNLAFWTGIGVFTWFASQHVCPLGGGCLLVMFVVYLATLFVWTIGWQVPLHAAHQTDRDFKHFYVSQAEGKPEDEDPKRPTREQIAATLRNSWRRSISQPWFWGQVLMTAVFLLLSFIIIMQSKGNKIPTPTGDSLNVSGDNLKDVLKKMMQ